MKGIKQEFDIGKILTYYVYNGIIIKQTCVSSERAEEK